MLAREGLFFEEYGADGACERKRLDLNKGRAQTCKQQNQYSGLHLSFFLNLQTPLLRKLCAKGESSQSVDDGCGVFSCSLNVTRRRHQFENVELPPTLKRSIADVVSQALRRYFLLSRISTVARGSDTIHRKKLQDTFFLLSWCTVP